MNRWPTIALLLAALVATSATAAIAITLRPRPMPSDPLDALIDAQQFDLLSLGRDPESHDYYRGYKTLGQTRITDIRVRQKLIDALFAGIHEKHSTGKCFDPRHGIRIIRYGHVAEYAICFSCGHSAIFVDGEHVGGFSSSPTPKSVFNEVLKIAGVPLAYDPH